MVALRQGRNGLLLNKIVSFMVTRERGATYLHHLSSHLLIPSSLLPPPSSADEECLVYMTLDRACLQCAHVHWEHGQPIVSEREYHICRLTIEHAVVSHYRDNTLSTHSRIVAEDGRGQRVTRIDECAGSCRKREDQPRRQECPVRK